MKKIIIYLLIGFVVYYFISKYLEKRKYYNYFKDMGFGSVLLDRFSLDELKTSYNYIKGWRSLGRTLTYEIDPVFYNKVKSINNKYNIFSSI